MASPEECVRFLATSQNRVALLEALDDGPLRPVEICERLSLSRSATHRNLRDLTDRGWAKRVDDGYIATVCGRLVLGAYNELEETVRLVAEYGSSLEPLADAGLTLSPATLDDAAVTTATENDPHAPLRHYVERVHEIELDRFRGITPVVSPLFNEAHQPVLSEGADAELLLGSSALSTSKTDYETEFDSAMTADGLTLYVHPDPLSFGLSIVDERVFLGAYEGGQFVACFEWTDPEIRAEAIEAYESYRAAASEVDSL